MPIEPEEGRLVDLLQYIAKFDAAVSADQVHVIYALESFSRLLKEILVQFDRVDGVEPALKRSDGLTDEGAGLDEDLSL